MDGERAVWTCILLGGALTALIWCSVDFARANPHRRLPGKLPDAVHPPGYMLVGMLGIVGAVAGGVLAAGSFGGLSWLITAAALGVGLMPPQFVHNRRLRRSQLPPGPAGRTRRAR